MASVGTPKVFLTISLSLTINRKANRDKIEDKSKQLTPRECDWLLLKTFHKILKVAELLKSKNTMRNLNIYRLLLWEIIFGIKHLKNLLDQTEENWFIHRIGQNC